MAIEFLTEDARVVETEYGDWDVSMVVAVDDLHYRMHTVVPHDAGDPVAAAIEPLSRQVARMRGEA